jgi:Protein of unknown function (DUF2630)
MENQDNSILQRIDQLVSEEHALLEEADGGSLEGDAHARLESVQVMLDQCWDLLRQRRARREVGKDPDKAYVRDPSTVEQYRQ